MKPLMTLGLMMTLVAATAGSAAADASRRGLPVAYAAIDGASGMVVAYGGKGTAAANSSRQQTSNNIVVTFSGRFPSDITPDKVILQTTAKLAYYEVAGAKVEDATPTQIVVRIYTWESFSTATYQGDVWVTAYVGRTP